MVDRAYEEDFQSRLFKELALQTLVCYYYYSRTKTKISESTAEGGLELNSLEGQVFSVTEAENPNYDSASSYNFSMDLEEIDNPHYEKTGLEAMDYSSPEEMSYGGAAAPKNSVQQATIVKSHRWGEHVAETLRGYKDIARKSGRDIFKTEFFYDILDTSLA